MSLGYCMFMLIYRYTFATTEVPIIWIYDKNNDYKKLSTKHCRQFRVTLGLAGRKSPPPQVATQRNVFISGVLRETKDHLPGTITVAFNASVDKRSLVIHILRVIHTKRCIFTKIVVFGNLWHTESPTNDLVVYPLLSQPLLYMFV